MNLCPACGEDFASISAFDDHRVGRHKHLYSPEHPEGRRCLSPLELKALGMPKDCRGRWRLPIRGTHPWTSDATAENGKELTPQVSDGAGTPRRQRQYNTREGGTGAVDNQARCASSRRAPRA